MNVQPQPSWLQEQTSHTTFLDRFYQSVVLNTFETMTLGCLKIEMPDGTIRVIGQPGADISALIRVIHPTFFKRCVLYGDIGFGESFVDGDWETDDMTKVIKWAILNVENLSVMSGAKTKNGFGNVLRLANRLRHLWRSNTVTMSRRNIHEHYDLGNDFYRLFLDETMTYSSAYFQSPEQSLTEAQIAKYDVLCRKLRLKPTDHVLEIGSGWGGFSCYAAQTYGCRITTVTISDEQFQYAQEKIQREGLADKIEIKLQDYRLITGQFDKIVSIEMLEAVGDAFLETYFSKCHELLKHNGLLGLQIITCPDSRYDSFRKNVDWIQKHIFPGSLLLSVGRINQAINRTGDLFLFHLEDIGNCYTQTLSLWREAFNQKLDQVRALGFNEPFIRKWNYYLCYCQAAFAMRNISVVQAVFTRPNNLTLTEE